MQLGVVVSTFFTLLIPLAQSGTQLIIIRMLTGVGLGFAISARVVAPRRVGGAGENALAVSGPAL